MLTGGKVSFKSMFNAVQTAYSKYKEKKWTTKNVIAYLKANCIGMVLIEEIVKDWDNNKENTQYDYTSKLLAVWFAKNSDIDTHIDTIMHLMFLGVTQKIGYVIKQILTKHNKYSAFHSAKHSYVQIRDMNLDWCKILPFGPVNKPFSSWVSENCLAYVITMKTI